MAHLLRRIIDPLDIFKPLTAEQEAALRANTRTTVHLGVLVADQRNPISAEGACAPQHAKTVPNAIETPRRLKTMRLIELVLEILGVGLGLLGSILAYS